MQKGKINVTTENIFPIIKKFLYSDQEIFLRELVSNAVDATQKLKTLASKGEYKKELGDLTIRISADNKKNTITVSDSGLGMTEEELDKYINQIAFSSAEEFLSKYKNDAAAIIGHFGLGFYSSFMVAKKVEVITKSYKDDAPAIKWVCEGNPEFEIEKAKKEDIGTDVILYLDDDSKEYSEEHRVEEILKKYCKFLPVPIAFGKEKEWKDEKYVDTDKDKIINNTEPAWTKKPADLTEEDYKKFYKELYPASYEDPLFNIHLNVDYPFNLTGILYFPKIKSNIEIQKNKIQLYCNQVFVTDSVEGIVPDFLTLLHGVLDSPDIPLNVSRSYLQGDPNVKKISNHIMKKVADRLNEIYKNDRNEFEKKWSDLKLFITYGMISEEKFYDRAKDFVLVKNTEGKYFTLEEYKNVIKENQTDKDKKIIHLYTQDPEEQYTSIEAAKAKGYDVLLMDGQLDTHFINHVESKVSDIQFVRVDADVVDKLIKKDEHKQSHLSQDEQDELSPVFESQLNDKNDNFSVVFESLGENDNPVVITQSEFMRRMKDISKLSGPEAGFYEQLPDSYNLVVNTDHRLIKEIIDEKEKAVGEKVKSFKEEAKPVNEEIKKLEEAKKDKKEEEIPQADKDKLEELNKKSGEINEKKQNVLMDFGKDNKLVKQVIDLALLANGMLKGEPLTKFVKRSVELIG